MKKYYTAADAGSVRIGNDQFTILVPNGYGDGATTVHILERDEELPDEELPEARFFTSFSGKDIKIYAYDCGGDAAVARISGRFGAYVNDKKVYFIRWE